MPIAPAADALVIFGVTGDLAAKMLLPALAQLADRGVTPRIVGVAHAPREPGDIPRNVTVTPTSTCWARRSPATTR